MSDQMKLESADGLLLQEMASLRDIIDNNSDWIWEVDAQGRYVFSSNKCIEFLGVPPEEVIGKTPFDFMPPDEAKRVGEQFAAIVERPLADYSTVISARMERRLFSKPAVFRYLTTTVTFVVIAASTVI